MTRQTGVSHLQSKDTHGYFELGDGAGLELDDDPWVLAGSDNASRDVSTIERVALEPNLRPM